MTSKHGSKLVVVAALCGNLAIAITKFIAAGITGSSAMISEGVHSTVDTTNQVLLLYGMKRAGRPASASHPFGHGRELYFWAFIVALLVFALGAGISIYEGIAHVRHPEPMSNPLVNYIVLGISLLFEGGTWWVALREFRRQKGEMGYFEAFRRSKDPTTFTVQMGPTEVVAALSAEFEDALNTPEIEACIGRIEGAVARAHPAVTVLFVKPQTNATWRDRMGTP